MLLDALRKAVNAEVLRAGKKLPAVFLVDHYLNLAGRDFLNETKLRRIHMNEATPTPYSGATTLYLHDDTIEVLEVYYNNVRLSRTSREELSVFDPNWQTVAAGTPHSYLTLDNKTIRVYPACSANSSVKYDAALGWSTDLADGANADPAGNGRGVPPTYHMALVYWAADKLAPSPELKAAYAALVEKARTESAQAFAGYLDGTTALPANA